METLKHHRKDILSTVSTQSREGTDATKDVDKTHITLNALPVFELPKYLLPLCRNVVSNNGFKDLLHVH